MGTADHRSIKSPIPPAVPHLPKSNAASAKPSLQAIQGGAGEKPVPVEEARKTDWRDMLDSAGAKYVLGAISIGSVLLAWYLATKYQLDFYVRFGNIPAPGEVFGKVLEVNQSSQFIMNVGISLRRVLLGFFIATGAGILLGILIGRYKIFRALTMPALEVFRPIPAIAWVPMAIMLWPSNEVSIVFITFLGAFFPILINTIHGVEEIDDVLFRAARSLGTREKDLLLYVVVPGALQHIFTGLSVGMGVAWVSLIAAEMISGQFGIGYFTWEAYSLIAYSEIALGMITIGILGLVCSKVIQVCSRIATPWIGSTAGGAR